MLPLIRGLRCPPAFQPKISALRHRFHFHSNKLLTQFKEAQQNRIFKHLKSRRQIKPPSILMIWAQNGVQFMIFVPGLCFPSAAASAVLFYPSTFTINIIIIPSPRQFSRFFLPCALSFREKRMKRSCVCGGNFTQLCKTTYHLISLSSMKITPQFSSLAKKKLLK